MSATAASRSIPTLMLLTRAGNEPRAENMEQEAFGSNCFYRWADKSWVSSQLKGADILPAAHGAGAPLTASPQAVLVSKSPREWASALRLHL
jgi:hypothetical protein